MGHKVRSLGGLEVRGQKRESQSSPTEECDGSVSVLFLGALSIISNIGVEHSDFLGIMEKHGNYVLIYDCDWEDLIFRVCVPPILLQTERPLFYFIVRPAVRDSLFALPVF